jgi:hypothetical protein
LDVCPERTEQEESRELMPTLRWTCIRIRCRNALGRCAEARARRRQNRLASPLAGGKASYGKDNQNGAQMAIDELSTQGLKIRGKAVKFELLAEDDQADPKGRSGIEIADPTLPTRRRVQCSAS